MKLTIRAANVEDVPAFYELTREMAVELGEEKYLTNSLEAMIKDFDKYKCLLAFNESDELMGYLLYCDIYCSWQGRAYYLDDVYITQKFRRNNLATILMDELVKIAKENEIKLIRWYVLKDNTGAIELYKKYGAKFEENRYRCNYFINI